MRVMEVGVWGEVVGLLGWDGLLVVRVVGDEYLVALLVYAGTGISRPVSTMSFWYCSGRSQAYLRRRSVGHSLLYDVVLMD